MRHWVTSPVVSAREVSCACVFTSHTELDEQTATTTKGYASADGHLDDHHSSTAITSGSMAGARSGSSDARSTVDWASADGRSADCAKLDRCERILKATFASRCGVGTPCDSRKTAYSSSCRPACSQSVSQVAGWWQAEGQSLRQSFNCDHRLSCSCGTDDKLRLGN